MRTLLMGMSFLFGDVYGAWKPSRLREEDLVGMTLYYHTKWLIGSMDGDIKCSMMIQCLM
jgi:hypothetical protein